MQEGGGQERKGNSRLPSPLLPFVALAPILAPPKSEICLEQAEKPTEALATQAKKTVTYSRTKQFDAIKPDL